MFVFFVFVCYEYNCRLNKSRLTLFKRKKERESMVKSEGKHKIKRKGGREKKKINRSKG